MPQTNYPWWTLGLVFGPLLGLGTAPVFAQGLPRDISVGSAHEEKRVALVIGNSSYPSAPLRNPVNDARTIARVLSSQGFDVTPYENLGQTAMKRAVLKFGETLQQGGVGLFYYAGHGMQVGGRNYLIPVDAIANSEAEVEVESVDLAYVLARFEAARNRLNLVILDACRNNPFQRRFRSTSQGLGSIDAPAGTLIAFATAPGRVARDGDGENGLYTGELVRQMVVPGLKVEDVFKRVRLAIQRATNGEQVPWESSSLVGDFVFSSPRGGETASLDAERRRLEEERLQLLAERAQLEQLKKQQEVRKEPPLTALLPNDRVEESRRLQAARILKEIFPRNGPFALEQVTPEKLRGRMSVEARGRYGSGRVTAYFRDLENARFSEVRFAFGSPGYEAELCFTRENLIWDEEPMLKFMSTLEDRHVCGRTDRGSMSRQGLIRLRDALQILSGRQFPDLGCIKVTPITGKREDC